METTPVSNVAEIAAIADEIEVEMRRLGYWQSTHPDGLDSSAPYSGVSFEAWLQFVFLFAVKRAVRTGDFREVPPYRVGVAALRQYDYHSSIPEAHPLMNLCFKLEKALPSSEMR